MQTSESERAASSTPIASSVVENPQMENSISEAAPVSGESLRNILSSMMATQQSQMLSALTDQISRLVENSIQNCLSLRNLNNIQRTDQQSSLTNQQQVRISDRPLRTSLTPPQISSVSPHQDFLGFDTNGSQPCSAPAVTAPTICPLRDASSVELNVRPVKFLQIISNWRIKFNGGHNGLSVEHFIYRVEALTRQTLNGNYNLLCSNAGLLFEGKADYWFWRYHMSVPSINWPDLCIALRRQYKDSRTDIDIRELVRDRKQKVNESFDGFYEAIVSLTDLLAEPLPEKLLVEILRRNLLPEIQHEILNLSITTVEELRDICRRREFFIQDMRRRHGSHISKPLPKRVAEIFHESENDIENQNVEIDEVAALALKCWNCRRPGHRYQDCLAERTIFCYGCGKADTYKPNCTKCNPKNSGASTSTALRSTNWPSKQPKKEMN